MAVFLMELFNLKQNKCNAQTLFYGSVFDRTFQPKTEQM